ncbi:MAG: class I SAM-dependent methyltransferase [Neisseriaceae bacterium]|nr:class I SAM-dependent methyltransferase [Neisseriaceae bacterium]
MTKNKQINDLLSHNQTSWDKQAEEQHEWSRPVSREEVDLAKQGRWQVHLTPSPCPINWLGDIKGKRILCLASAGGQQAPILSAAGAKVTVFDLSKKQLEQDQNVAQRDHLDLITVQGDMADLSVFDDRSFDLIFHPISNLYVPDVRKVWQECYRVLAEDGRLLSGFYNPVVYIHDKDPIYHEQGVIKPRYKLPYSDLKDLPAEMLDQKRNKGEAFVFGHSLTDLIAGQIDAGFSINGFYEDEQPKPRFLIDLVIPTFLATYATKGI